MSEDAAENASPTCTAMVYPRRGPAHRCPASPKWRVMWQRVVHQGDFCTSHIRRFVNLPAWYTITRLADGRPWEPPEPRSIGSFEVPDV